MFPFSRMVVYGNNYNHQNKIEYDFNAGVSKGSVPVTISGGSYGTIPAVPSNIYGYTRGIHDAIINVPSFTIGTGDFNMEATYYLDTNAVNIYTLICTTSIGNTGMQYGDGGYGNRLSAFINAVVANDVDCVNQSRNVTDYQKVIKFRLERKASVQKLYVNNVQVPFAIGASTSFTNMSIVNTNNVVAQTQIKIGSPGLYVANFFLDY